jgi:histidine triad (HIT) family protein
VHIVPRRKKDGLRGFFWPRQAQPGEAHMQEAQAAIRAALERIEMLKLKQDDL